MEITNELLETIYTRANQYCFAKYGKEADRLQLNEYGNIDAVWTGYNRGDDDNYETVTAENLTADLDEVAKQRAIDEEAYREKERVRQAERQRQRDEEQLRNRKAEYLRLKKEFEQ